MTAGQDVAASVANDIVTYHTFPEETARIARDAGVGHLGMTRILRPMLASVLHPAFIGDSRKIYDGPVTVASGGRVCVGVETTVILENYTRYGD